MPAAASSWSSSRRRKPQRPRKNTVTTQCRHGGCRGNCFRVFIGGGFPVFIRHGVPRGSSAPGSRGGACEGLRGGSGLMTVRCGGTLQVRQMPQISRCSNLNTWHLPPSPAPTASSIRPHFGGDLRGDLDVTLDGARGEAGFRGGVFGERRHGVVFRQCHLSAASPSGSSPMLRLRMQRLVDLLPPGQVFGVRRCPPRMPATRCR